MATSLVPRWRVTHGGKIESQLELANWLGSAWSRASASEMEAGPTESAGLPVTTCLAVMLQVA
jgi:hypothetical protein